MSTATAPQNRKETKSRGKFKQELTKRQRDDIQTAFNLFDTDGSGTIEKKELKVGRSVAEFES